MAPLATIDFVGWDVHKAIVDNLLANTRDEAHAAFKMPALMTEAMARGCLGDKTPEQGGFFCKQGKAVIALDGKTADVPELARRMKALHRVGRYREAFDLFAEASGPDAELMRRVVLGYLSYGLCRVGEVVESVADVDRIMGFGFNWAPPGALADTIGLRRSVKLLEAAKLPVPKVLAVAAERNQNLYDPAHGDIGRFFHA
jgi:3-hydroxyacyl-CoA dehydrogenase